MKTTNLGETDGLPTIEWSQVETQLSDLLTHDDPRCAISVATKGFDVMVAGEARRITNPKIVAEVAGLWAKGGWPAQPDDSGTGITAPFNAPTLGPPPWFVYEVKPRTATAVGTAEETPGSTRWRF
jgi:hypothetical protein